MKWNDIKQRFGEIISVLLIIIFILCLIYGVVKIHIIDKTSENVTPPIERIEIDTITKINNKLIIEVETLDSIKDAKVIEVKSLDNDSTLRLFYELIRR